MQRDSDIKHRMVRATELFLEVSRNELPQQALIDALLDEPDTRVAAILCRLIAHGYDRRGESSLAERWRADAEALKPRPGHATYLLAVQAAARGDTREALHQVEELVLISAVSHGLIHAAHILAGHIALGSGSVDEAHRRLSLAMVPPPVHFADRTLCDALDRERMSRALCLVYRQWLEQADPIPPRVRR
jgi:hypothetical protein